MNKEYRIEELHETLNIIRTHIILQNLESNPMAVSLKDLGGIDMSCVAPVRDRCQSCYEEL